MKKIAFVTIALILIASISFSTLAANNFIQYTDSTMPYTNALALDVYPTQGVELGQYIGYNSTFKMVNPGQSQFEDYFKQELQVGDRTFRFNNWYSAFRWENDQQIPNNVEGYFDQEFLDYEVNKYNFGVQFELDNLNMGGASYAVMTVGAVISLDTLSDQALENLKTNCRIRLYTLLPNGTPVYTSNFGGEAYMFDYYTETGRLNRAYVGVFVIDTEEIWDLKVGSSSYWTYRAEFTFEIDTRYPSFITDVSTTDMTWSYTDEPINVMQDIHNSMDNLESDSNIIKDNISDIKNNLDNAKEEFDSWYEDHNINNKWNGYKDKVDGIYGDIDKNNDTESSYEELEYDQKDKFDIDVSVPDSVEKPFWTNAGYPISSFITSLWSNPFIAMCTPCMMILYVGYILLYRG